MRYETTKKDYDNGWRADYAPNRSKVFVSPAGVLNYITTTEKNEEWYDMMRHQSARNKSEITGEKLTDAGFTPWQGDTENVFIKKLHSNDLINPETSLVIMIRKPNGWEMRFSREGINLTLGVSSKTIHNLMEINDILRSFFGCEIKFK